MSTDVIINREGWMVGDGGSTFFEGDNGLGWSGAHRLDPTRRA